VNIDKFRGKNMVADINTLVDFRKFEQRDQE
jgi:hypothetical protein